MTEYLRDMLRAVHVAAKEPVEIEFSVSRGVGRPAIIRAAGQRRADWDASELHSTAAIVVPRVENAELTIQVKGGFAELRMLVNGTLIRVLVEQ